METNDLRDRLARAEQDIKNHKENFSSFKADDFGSLKKEVHTMRGELNQKIDDLHELASSIKEDMTERTHQINMMLAKWTGGFMVVMFVGEFLAKKLFG